MKKGGSILVFICALSLCLVIGIFIGRNLKDDYSPLPQNSAGNEIFESEETKDYRININSASKVQLMELPGIGETISERIISYRTEHGPFQSTDDLLNVAGIGEKTLMDIEHLIVAGG